MNVVRACGRFGVPLTARGGGTSQAGQSIGPGVILDTSKYFNEILEIDPGGPAGAGPAGLRARRPQPRAQAARAQVRPRHLDGQPSHDRRHDRQQLLGRALGRLRQDGRPRPRAEGRPGRRQRRRDRPARRGGARGEVPPGRPRRRALPRRSDGWPPSTPTRSSAATRRSSAASAGYDLTVVPARGGRAVRPDAAVRRVGGDARRGRRGDAPAGRAAEGEGGARRAVRRPARRAGGDARDPRRTAPRRSR